MIIDLSQLQLFGYPGGYSAMCSTQRREHLLDSRVVCENICAKAVSHTAPVVYVAHADTNPQAHFSCLVGVDTFAGMLERSDHERRKTSLPEQLKHFSQDRWYLGLLRQCYF